VKRDIRAEKVKTEVKTVADIEARVKGIHKRRKTGIIRTPTVRETMSNFERAEMLLLE
jgi:hypothetical protein